MEDYKYKLSVIIPMYNAEKYIANCLNSILESDLPKGEYEVIIINDGSKDNSPNIAQGYCSQHEDFTYLSQENQGQSVARNYGIEKACGEYLWFVDSDDRIDKKINDILVKIKELGKPDAFSFYLQYVSEEGKHLTKAFYFPGKYNTLMTGRDAVVNGYQPSSVCVFFIRKKYIDALKLRFYPGIYHQDSEFSYRMMAHAKSVYFSAYVPYIYIKHENTVVTTTSKNMIIKKDLDDITIIKSYLKLSKEFEKSDSELSRVISDHCDGMIFGLAYSIYKKRNDESFQERNSAVLSSLIDNGFYPMKIRFVPIRRNLLKLFLNAKRIIYDIRQIKLVNK